MSGNEFVNREQKEQEKANTENVALLIGQVRDLTSLVKEVQKELRTAREELRNIGKLRPLRVKADEADSSKTAMEMQASQAEEKVESE